MFENIKIIFVNPRILFLKNIGVRQTIVKNTFWLTVAEVITQILKLVLIIYTARILGAIEYGKFSFALSFVAIAVIFSELGLPDIITRELSRNQNLEKEYSSIISLKVFLSIAMMLLIYIVSFFITSDPVIRSSIWLLSYFILITSFLNILYAFFRARQKMEYEAISKIIQYIILTSFGFLVLLLAPSIKNLSYAYLITNLAVLILILFFFNRFVSPLRISYDKKVWKKYLKSSWPLAGGLIISWIYVSVSSIMLGYFGYNIENGWYNAAYKIIGAIAISAVLISRSFFPVLSKFSIESKEKIKKVWNYQKELMIIFAFPIIIGGIVLAPKIISFFYDSSYYPSIFAFQLLVFVSGVDFLYYPYASALIIFNHEKRNFGLIIIGLIISIILNIFLIPRYTLYGAATSVLISSVIVLLLAIIATRIYTPIRPFNAEMLKTFVAVIFSGLVMFFLISMPKIYNLNFILVIIIGMISYFLVLFACYKTLRINKLLSPWI
ncbi:MAG: hypothetical protein A2908_01620 [Candidatus Staskawiczbacteria bacterium RIFCSPLOWO2_01_FULL_38_12b]|uniref:Uncharacterized protein n=1 Tax=Candidatus Staskawiczbacteria bacterium RIFCSPLOWO2_01_FULL_38_12b TaxID=1802214 RepID=A0A1G2IDB3_9BACT|nr:MAG: hypothetical protein A2908_01620 [Candidatus Staskawiczbacteria bacterium RIFCSPLOWO2_01_FULL_38_12b]